MLWITFHSFARFDDEGYYLLALSALAHHYPLYTKVYGTYGPANYVLFGAAFAVLHLPLTTDAGRFLTVALWAVAAGLSGMVVWRACRSAVLAIAGVAVGYGWLIPVGISGAVSPSCLIVPLQLVLVILLPGAVKGHRRTVLLVCGAIVGTILMVKVNVGIFTIAAIAVAIACTSGHLRHRRGLWWTSVGLGLALPLALVVGLIRAPWVVEYLVGSEAAVLAFLAATRLTAASELQGLPLRQTLPWLAGGCLAAMAVYIIAIARGGTPVSDVLSYTFLVPIRQTHAFVVAVPIDGASAALMVLVASGATWLVWASQRSTRSGAWERRHLDAMASAKVLIGAAVIFWGVTSSFPFGPAFGAVFMGLAAFAPPADPIGGLRREVLWLVAAFGTFEQLQMYPVAGIQIAAGTVWFGLAGIIMIDDGLRRLGRRRCETNPPAKALRLPRPVRAARAAMTALVAAGLLFQFQEVRAASPADTTSLRLAGSSWIQLPRPEAQQYQNVVAYLRRNCTTFISAPGIDSLYAWSDEPAPLGLLVDDWMYLISARAQRAELHALATTPRLCAVLDPSLLRFWQHGTRLPPDPVLLRLSTAFVRTRDYGGIEILRRRTGTS